MKNYFILSVVLFSTILFNSCKEDKKIEDKPKLNNYSIELDLTIKKTDSLQLFYTDSINKDFSEERSLWMAVNGDTVPQLVKFEIPAGIVPNNVRLDFTNKSQEIVVFNNLKIGFKDKIFTENDSIIGKCFSINSGVIPVDSLKTIDFNKKLEIYDPFIYSTETLSAKMVELSK